MGRFIMIYSYFLSWGVMSKSAPVATITASQDEAEDGDEEEDESPNPPWLEMVRFVPSVATFVAFFCW